MNMFLKQNWLDLSWSSWASLENEQELKQCPYQPGIYRIKGKDKQFIVYIGQTGNLRRRLLSLRRNYLKENMPFNDPHTAAPSLWAWRNAEEYEYEWSVTLQNIDCLKSLESLILYKYRCEKGESPLCNFGRFHKNYVKSKSRKDGFIGGRSKKKNSAEKKSILSLKKRGTFRDLYWMDLDWSARTLFRTENICGLPVKNSLYLFCTKDLKELLYIGETTNLKERFSSYISANEFLDTYFSWVAVPECEHKHQLREYENDLIGAHIEDEQCPPTFQFKGKKK